MYLLAFLFPQPTIFAQLYTPLCINRILPQVENTSARDEHEAKLIIKVALSSPIVTLDPNDISSQVMYPLLPRGYPLFLPKDDPVPIHEYFMLNQDKSLAMVDLSKK